MPEAIEAATAAVEAAVAEASADAAAVAAASAEAAIEAAEDRVEAAEAARDALAEAAMRDELCRRIDAVRTECETWRNEVGRQISQLETTVTGLRAELSTMAERLPALVVVPTPVTDGLSTPASSPATAEAPAGAVIVPAAASPAAIVAAPVAPAKRKGRFL